MIESKMIALSEVSDLIQSDSDVIVAMCANEPQGCLAEFHKAAPRVRDVNVFSCLTLKPYDFFMDPKMKGHFYLCSWFHGPAAREAVRLNIGTVSFVPNMVHRAVLDRLCVRKPHLFVGACTPPDKNGFVSLSCSLVYEKNALEAADVVLLEINENLPRTYGDTQVHIDDVDYFVENHKEVPFLKIEAPSDTELKIGEHIANLVEDGSTIQLGIGGIPNAVATCLKNKKDLGVHTEMLVDSMMELALSGAINNKNKSLLKGKIVATFSMGTPKLYDWLDDNLLVEFHRGEWVNDPRIIKKNSKMVSINTCLMMDLSGQVASEAIGMDQYSGTGGQSDTAVGAKEGYDRLGKSIIALRSTPKNGEFSTIVPVFPEGTPTTLHRSHCDYVVTEYGVTCLRGRSIRERALALIEISHPRFREQLKNQAKELGVIP